MGNPYSDSNPYIIRQPQNQTLPQLGSLALRLYLIKGKNGTTKAEWRVGKTAPGEATDIPGAGQGGEAVGLPGAQEPDLSLVDPSSVQYTGPTVEAGDFATLTAPSSLEGLTVPESSELAGLGASTADVAPESATSAGGGASLGGVALIAKGAFMNKDQAAENIRLGNNNSNIFEKYYNESSQHPVAAVMTPGQFLVDTGAIGKDTLVGKITNFPAQFEEWGVDKIRKLFGGLF